MPAAHTDHHSFGVEFLEQLVRSKRCYSNQTPGMQFAVRSIFSTCKIVTHWRKHKLMYVVL